MNQIFLVAIAAFYQSNAALTNPIESQASVKQKELPPQIVIARKESFDPKLVALFEESNAENSVIGGLIAASRLGEAYDRAVKIRNHRPELKEFLNDFFIDACLLTGHYREAKTALHQMLALKGYRTSERYIKLSLASAALGEASLDHGQTAKEAFVKHYTRRTHKEPARSMLGDRPKDIVLTSALALGLRGDIVAAEYLELALRLDPRNEIAAKSLVRFYDDKGRFSDLRRVAFNIAENLPDGLLREEFLKDAKRVLNRQDRPIDLPLNGKT